MESKIARLVRTFTFRLALVYVGLFAFSVIVLFAFIYTFATRYLQAQTADAIRLQYNYLLNDYRENGSSGVEARIRELVADDDDGTEIYLLVNNKYENIAGNLNEWPHSAQVDTSFERTGEWVRFHIEGSRSSPQTIEVMAVKVPLSKWRYMLIGKSLQNNEKIEQTIVQTFWASLLVTLVMAFFGAIVMTRSVMQRINVINRSAEMIIHGELTARIPTVAGGDEFDDLSANLNHMLDKIQMLLQSLSQFANNIAHDLRSPLNRIINRLDAGLRNIDDTNPARTLLEKNISDMQELIGTFNSILKISELEANTQFRKFPPCDLSVLLEHLVEFYEPYAADKEMTLTTDIQPALQVPAEKNLLSQAFANLLDNAIKFTPRGGHISLSAVQDGEFIHVVVADSGVGIPPDFHDKVFQKFFRLEQSRNTKGNGLGLSLVDAIARIHGATIALEDNAPGLRVKLSFPLGQ
jgi:signal transduction histidine kinase